MAWQAEKLLEFENLLSQENVNLGEDELRNLRGVFRDLDLLRAVPISVRNELAPRLRVVRLKKDEILVSPLDQLPPIYILLRGQVKLSKYDPYDMELEREEKKHSDVISNRGNSSFFTLHREFPRTISA